MTQATPAPTLVIGGSGFIGGAILAALVAQGRPVRALARSAASADDLRRRGADPVTGDVLDTGSLIRAMEGCAVVYHAAGVNSFCLADPGPMERVNVDGSANVIAAAAQAGAGRVIYTSSAAAIGEAPGTAGTESSPHRGWFLSQYERTKYLAEIRVRHEAAAHGVSVVYVSPSSVQGPGRLHGTAQLLLRYLNGNLRFLVDTQVSFLDIADCTAGHLLAESGGADGERYILNGATFTTRELIVLLSETTGIGHRVRWLPGWSAMAGATVAQAAARAVRRDPPLCREMIRTLLNGHHYDGSRAERELGLHYTPVKDTLRSTLRWYAENGYLTEKR
ncbi:MAG TPA: NAD-dependent epimerase/dehydratase family protein [Streptosporangiaceae bacterium]|nr:NAD-dependent epimerase/dehydratase family protein [Streptosporangiaceae bacterium]